jgi:hypothetical protein
MILAHRGRGLAVLIRHLSHLDTIGWVMLISIAAISILIAVFFHTGLKAFMKKRMRMIYPDFSWLVLPKMGHTIGGMFFVICFSFLGYMSPIAEDIGFFFFIGMTWFVICFVKFLANKNCAIMKNKQDVYISKFYGLSKYRKYCPNQICCSREIDKNGDVSYTLIYEGKKIGRYSDCNYSRQASELINNEIINKLTII